MDNFLSDDPMQASDPRRMSLDAIIEAHFQGGEIRCPACGKPLRVLDDANQRAVFCETDPRHFYLVPTNSESRREIDSLIDAMRQRER
jgi:hypothetical protein